MVATKKSSAAIVKMRAVALAKANAKSYGRYRRAFKAYMLTLDSLPDVRFWTNLERLVSLILNFSANPSRFDMKDVATTFFQRAMSNLINQEPEDLLEALRFVKAYDKWVGVARHNLNVAMENKRFGQHLGDDSFGDVCDSFPLVGEEIMKALTDFKIVTWAGLEKLLLEARPFTMHVKNDETSFSNFVLFGENYIAMALHDAAEKAFYSTVAEKEINKYY